jgi:hypothetical protein
MSGVKTLALAVALLFALAGCAWMFEFNLFGGLDNPPAPTAADYQGSDGLDRLDEDLDSPSIIDAMTPAVVAEIEQDLWDSYLDDGVSGEDDQRAAILYADLALKTSEGEELVNNLAQVMLEVTIDENTTVAEILADIIPPEARADPAVFAAMINAFLTANDAYLLLGDWVDGLTADGSAENDLPPGSLPGDVAQKALVAYTMTVTVAAVIPVSVPATEAQAIAELFTVANGGASPATSITPDPFDTAAPFNTPPGPDHGILALLDLGGMSVP